MRSDPAAPRRPDRRPPACPLDPHPLNRHVPNHDLSYPILTHPTPLLFLPSSFSSERNAKYNQLLRIEEELGADAVYAGDNWRHIAI